MRFWIGKREASWGRSRPSAFVRETRSESVTQASCLHVLGVPAQLLQARCLRYVDPRSFHIESVCFFLHEFLSSPLIPQYEAPYHAIQNPKSKIQNCPRRRIV